MKNNKMVKYEENIFQKIWNKVKSLFSKNDAYEKPKVENLSENITVEKAPLTQFERTMNANRISDLVNKFEAGEVLEEELTVEQIKDLEEYYIYKNEEIDKEIQERKNELQGLSEKLARLRASQE